MTITLQMQPEHIARALDRLCAEHGIAPSRFGRTYFQDPRMIGDLRLGRRPRPKKVAQINAAIQSLTQEGGAA